MRYCLGYVRFEKKLFPELNVLKTLAWRRMENSVKHFNMVFCRKNYVERCLHANDA